MEEIKQNLSFPNHHFSRRGPLLQGRAIEMRVSAGRVPLLQVRAIEMRVSAVGVLSFRECHRDESFSRRGPLLQGRAIEMRALAGGVLSPRGVP